MGGEKWDLASVTSMQLHQKHTRSWTLPVLGKEVSSYSFQSCDSECWQGEVHRSARKHLYYFKTMGMTTVELPRTFPRLNFFL